MSLYTRIEVIDREGWRKDFQLGKNIILIGSASANDVVLARTGSGGVAPQHAQLMCSSEGYRLVNLSETEIWLGPSAETPLAPRAFAEIEDGARIKVGDFTLVLGGGRDLPRAAVDAGSSRAIELRMSLAETVLGPSRPLEGSVVVHNAGDKPGVQFRLQVEGWPPEQYDMGPGPILYPNAEKEVFFRLRHPRGPDLLAGKHRLLVRASASEAYPDQRVEVSQEIEVLSFYSHTLRLMPADQGGGISKDREEA